MFVRIEDLSGEGWRRLWLVHKRSSFKSMSHSIVAHHWNIRKGSIWVFEHKVVKEKVELPLNCYTYICTFFDGGVLCTFTGVIFLFVFVLPSTSLWGVYSETFIYHYNVPLAHSFMRLCMICFLHMYILHYASYYYYYWSLLYSAVLRSRADSLRSHVILHERIAFYNAFLNIHRSCVLTALAWLVPHETAAISARSVYTIQPCTMTLHAKPHT